MTAKQQALRDMSAKERQVLRQEKKILSLPKVKIYSIVICKTV